MNDKEFLKFSTQFAEAELDSGGDPAELQQLFTLSNSLKDLLVPVRALSFKTSLRQRLETRRQATPRFQLIRTRQNIVLMAVAGAGSLLSIAGVVLIVLRKVKTTGKADRSTAAAPI
jgi:hypothetical protein